MRIGKINTDKIILIIKKLRHQRSICTNKLYELE